MNKKALIIIGVLTLVGCNNSLSSISFTSSSFIDMRTDEEKICQILKDVGQGNFTLSYVKNDKNFQDKYTKDYISYGYWNDGIALINPNNTREKLYRLGFTENGVEVLSSLMDVETNSVIEYSGIDYFIESDEELVGNEFDPSDIKKSDTLGYYIDNLEPVMVLSGILSHAEMTYMDSILLKLNDDGSLTFTPALLNNDRSEATHIFDEATFIDIGSTIDEKVDTFLKSFKAYDESLNIEQVSDFLVDTYTITTEVVNAKKYHYQGSKVMDITYTNTGDKVNLSSFNYNNKVSSSLFYENVNGDIVQKYLDATNTLNETEMGVSFDDYFNIKNVVKDLMPTFLKINDNVYRSFSTSAYQLLNIFTFTSFGNPLYVDAVMSSNKVDYFRFGFMESGIDSDGDFLHLLIKCDISEALEVKLPVKCEVDENTTLINDAFNYFENNDFIMHAISDNELIKRDIYKVDGYYIDLITMYNTYGDIYYYGGMGYYLSADTDIKFFNVSLNIEGVVEITSANVDSLEYFGGFNVAGEIFVIGENNKYYLKENVENIGYNILTGYNGSPGLGNIISSSFEMEIIDNKISSYSYEYASSSRNGRETINFTYNNLKLDASLKEKIDLFLSI